MIYLLFSTHWNQKPTTMTFCFGGQVVEYDEEQPLYWWDRERLTPELKYVNERQVI